jgi:hypothetical protein
MRLYHLHLLHHHPLLLPPRL